MTSVAASGTNVRTIGTDERSKQSKKISDYRAVLYRLIFLTLGGVKFTNRRDIIGAEL